MSPHAQDGGHRLALELPAAHSSVTVARRVLRHFARIEGVGARDTETLLLVASELLGNAVDHGGGGAARDEADLEGGARMELELEVRGAAWTLRVSDRGGGDVALLRRMLACDEPPDLEDERGRGLYLLGCAVDRLEVEASPDGRGVTFVARRTRAADGA